jgi:hypothetical protein
MLCSLNHITVVYYDVDEDWWYCYTSVKIIIIKWLKKRSNCTEYTQVLTYLKLAVTSHKAFQNICRRRLFTRILKITTFKPPSKCTKNLKSCACSTDEIKLKERSSLAWACKQKNQQNKDPKKALQYRHTNTWPRDLRCLNKSAHGLLHEWSALHVEHGDNINEGRTKEHSEVITYLLFKRNNINALILKYTYEKNYILPQTPWTRSTSKPCGPLTCNNDNSNNYAILGN